MKIRNANLIIQAIPVENITTALTVVTIFLKSLISKILKTLEKMTLKIKASWMNWHSQDSKRRKKEPMTSRIDLDMKKLTSTRMRCDLQINTCIPPI